MIDDYEYEEILEDKLDLLKIFMDEFVQQNLENQYLKKLMIFLKLLIKKEQAFFLFLTKID